MKKIIRTQQQIVALKAELKKELDNPDIFYGKEDLPGWIAELEMALSGVVEDDYSEIGYWLTNEKSHFGSAYGVV